MRQSADDSCEPLWQKLQDHAGQMSSKRVDALFDSDSDRAAVLSAEACGLFVDFSKQRVTAQTLQMLLDVARCQDLAGWREKMFRGDVVNNTEQRAALHVALRWPNEGSAAPFGSEILREVERVRTSVGQFSAAVRSGDWKGFTGEPIRDVVNIGIGGSDLGPAMVCDALREYRHPGIRCHFVSNADSSDLGEVLQQCNPATTLFIIASKTFSTQETLLNARSARAWLLEAAGGHEAAIALHFVAVSSALDRCAEFGIDQRNVFGFWDWVGGRYSLWSSIGLAVAVLIGMDGFRELQAGAHAMDQHFVDAPLEQNLPVLLGLIGIWNRNVLGASSLAVLPYDYRLQLLPAFLQQLEMESNGKRVSRAGLELTRNAAPVVWGQLGNNAQHAFYQMLHQGREAVPVDFLLPVFSQRPLPGHEDAVLSNALAQAEALMRGRSLTEAREQLAGQGMEGMDLEAAAQHLVMPGNRASTTILFERLTPQTLGALIALYEHKVFVQAVCWDVNPFDQFGVELGKSLAMSLLPALAAHRDESDAACADDAPERPGAGDEHDPSTRQLLARIREIRRRSDG